jgi:hypothetical protein
MITALHSIIDYEGLKILKIYESTFFGMQCLRLINMLQMMTNFLLG